MHLLCKKKSLYEPIPLILVQVFKGCKIWIIKKKLFYNIKIKINLTLILFVKRLILNLDDKKQVYLERD